MGEHVLTLAPGEGHLIILAHNSRGLLTEADEKHTGVEEDPTTKRLVQLEAQVAQQAQTHRQQALEREVHNLKKKYGDFDTAELFRHALTNRIPNLDAAFTHRTLRPR